MPAFLRRLLILAVLLGLGYWYAETYGVYAGYPPFTPVLLWDYTGAQSYEVLLRGGTNGLKLKVSGKLSRGSLKVWVSKGDRRVTPVLKFQGEFEKHLKWRLSPTRYTVHFAFQDARGWVKLDWVTTKYEGW